MDQTPLAHQLSAAIALYHEGHAQQAVEQLNRIVADHPDFIEAHFYLGFILQAHEYTDAALSHYQHVISLNPHHMDTLVNLGNLFFSAQDYTASLDYYQQALSVNPHHVDALNNLGYLLTQLGRHEEAQQCFDDALAIAPHHASVLTNKGILFFEMGNSEAAIDLFSASLLIEPNRINTLQNRCFVLRKMNRFTEALADCDHLALLLPHNIDILKLKINLFIDLKKYPEALAILKQIIPLEPHSEDLLLAQANLLKLTMQYDESLAIFNQLLALNPNHVMGLIDRGNVYFAQEKLNAAIADFDRVIAIDPNNTAAWMNKACVFDKYKNNQMAIACFKRIIDLMPNEAGAHIAILVHMQHLCDWSTLQQHIQRAKEIINADDYFESGQTIRIMPSSLFSIPDLTLADIHRFAQKYSMDLKQHAKQNTNLVLNKNTITHIGYFSADFNQHPVSQLMIEVLALHNRHHFKISAYSTRANDGSLLRKKVEAAVDHFVDMTHYSDAQIADKIIADRVDILVDLSGYTESSRSHILALRLAPIQVSYLGYLGTMGAPFIDYLIADDFLVPKLSETFYSEKILRLPSYQANDSTLVIEPKPSRTSCGLPEDAVVFCCFNMNYKITPAVFDIWCRLLKNIPNSVLWLYSNTSQATENLRKFALTRGIDAERLIVAPWLPLKEHLARIACADLFLDTSPYNAGTTASYALWVGLPVITCAGDTFSSRMAGSLLTALDVPELITFGWEDYYQLAYSLATNNEKRSVIKNKIKQNKNTKLLFNSQQFTQQLENAYRYMLDEFEQQR